MLKPLPTGRLGAFLCVLASALASCSGPSPNATPLTPAAPGAAAKAASSNDLIYAGAQHDIIVYSFPAGLLETTIKTAASIRGLCTDGKGDVWATATTEGKSGMSGVVYEVATKGVTAMSGLTVPDHQIPVNCSYDSKTGNLAVTSYNRRTFAPEIEVYENASGTPATYTSDFIGANPQPAYDDSGNLLVTSGGNVCVELPYGKQSLVEITLNETIGGVDHAQWYGKSFALESFKKSQNGMEKLNEHIYRLQISGTTGKIIGYTIFHGWIARDAGQSWIDDNIIVGTPGNLLVFWNYPKGGKAIKAIHPQFKTQAVTITSSS
jgi:hypothetical protein